MSKTGTSFPYDQYGKGKKRRDLGETDYYDSWQEAKEDGWEDDQIWSVTGEDYIETFGPPHHYVNHIGHVATIERHDGNTYFEEFCLWTQVEYEFRQFKEYHIEEFANGMMGKEEFEEMFEGLEEEITYLFKKVTAETDEPSNNLELSIEASLNKLEETT